MEVPITHVQLPIRSNASGFTEVSVTANKPTLQSLAKLNTIFQCQRDLAHSVLFGRLGTLQTTRSTRTSWRLKEPFIKPLTIPWTLPLTSTHVNRMLHGLFPVEMEDKWFIYVDGPYADGTANVNFHRGWTGRKVAELGLQLLWGDDDAKNLWEGQVTRLTYESEKTGWKTILHSSIKIVEGEEVLEVDVDDDDGKAIDDGYEGEEEDTAEEMAKFQVLKACQWVLGIKLVDVIEEPKSWARLAKLPVKMRLSTVTTYRGTKMSEETRKDLSRFGPGGVRMLVNG